MFGERILVELESRNLAKKKVYKIKKDHTKCIFLIRNQVLLLFVMVKNIDNGDVISDSDDEIIISRQVMRMRYTTKKTGLRWSRLWATDVDDGEE